MKWLRDNVAVLSLAVTLLVAIWLAFGEYQQLVKKKEFEARERVLRSALLDLAKCVDNPQYLGESQRADRDPSCETRVFRTLESPSGDFM